MPSARDAPIGPHRPHPPAARDLERTEVRTERLRSCRCSRAERRAGRVYASDLLSTAGLAACAGGEAAYPTPTRKAQHLRQTLRRLPPRSASSLGKRGRRGRVGWGGAAQEAHNAHCAPYRAPIPGEGAVACLVQTGERLRCRTFGRRTRTLRKQQGRGRTAAGPGIQTSLASLASRSPTSHLAFSRPPAPGPCPYVRTIGVRSPSAFRLPKGPPAAGAQDQEKRGGRGWGVSGADAPRCASEDRREGAGAGGRGGLGADARGSEVGL